MKGRVIGAVTACLVALVASAGAAVATASAQTAPGAPGAQSFFDLARKDCVGTARNTTSKVWFTVADGVLSDVYWPNVDATNVHTLQYLVTDGHTFTDLQTRDMTYSVVPDPTGWCARSWRRVSITTTGSSPPTSRIPHGTRC